MNLKDRILVLLASYFWAILGLSFLSTWLFFILPIAAFVYLFVGGRKHV